MTVPPTLIVFARQPHFGVGKTRLAKRIGKWEAWQFQRRQIRMLSKLARDTRWRFQFCWEHQQGTGDLGARMSRALGDQTGPKRLIIGSDIRGLSANHIAAAFFALNREKHVLGPTPDGGYWCIGTRVPLSLNKVRWSTEHALDDTVSGLRTAALTTTLEDLDE